MLSRGECCVGVVRERPSWERAVHEPPLQIGIRNPAAGATRGSPVCGVNEFRSLGKRVKHRLTPTDAVQNGRSVVPYPDRATKKILKKDIFRLFFI